MRRLTLGILLTFALATGAMAGELTETFDRTYDVRPGAQLELSNVNGGITVKAWDQPRVRVQATKRVESRDDDVAKKALDALKIEVRPSNGGLSIVTHYPKKDDSGIFDWILGSSNLNAQVKYEVTVPRQMSLELENVNGSIVASDVEGTHDLETTNGRIEVVRCAGTIDASTTNGGIRVELLRVTAGKGMRFETTNGRILLALPANLAAEIDASTTNGRIETELPVTTRSVSRNSLRGSVNGGGPQIKLRTTNGGIEIRTLTGGHAS